MQSTRVWGTWGPTCGPGHQREALGRPSISACSEFPATLLLPWSDVVPGTAFRRSRSASSCPARWAGLLQTPGGRQLLPAAGPPGTQRALAPAVSVSQFHLPNSVAGKGGGEHLKDSKNKNSILISFCFVLSSWSSKMPFFFFFNHFLST